MKIVDHDADDRGRRGVSRGDRWSWASTCVDYRNRVGNGFADCRVTSGPQPELAGLQVAL